MIVTAPPKAPTSPAERRERDRHILQARADGLTWRAIAEQFGVSERQARRCAQEAQRIAAEVTGSLDDLEPTAIMREIIDRQLGAFRRAAELADGESSNATVGAIRAVGSLGAELRSSLVASGVIPHRVAVGPGDVLALAAEGRALALRLAKACEEAGLSPAAILAVTDPEPLALPAAVG